MWLTKRVTQHESNAIRFEPVTVDVTHQVCRAERSSKRRTGRIGDPRSRPHRNYGRCGALDDIQESQPLLRQLIPRTAKEPVGECAPTGSPRQNSPPGDFRWRPTPAYSDARRETMTNKRRAGKLLTGSPIVVSAKCWESACCNHSRVVLWCLRMERPLSSTTAGFSLTPAFDANRI